MVKHSSLTLVTWGLLIILMLALTSGCGSSPKLLTKSLNDVSEISIIDYEHNSSITLTIDQDQEKITEIYNLVDSTKVTDHSDDKEGQTSDPRFIITFQYQDGTQDEIKSTETGNFIYRNVSATGWVGGENDKVHETIDSLFE